MPFFQQQLIMSNTLKTIKYIHHGHLAECYSSRFDTFHATSFDQGTLKTINNNISAAIEDVMKKTSVLLSLE